MAEKKDKFFVLNLDDIHDYLTPEGCSQLEEIAKYISVMREQSGRNPHPKYIVCNQGEPYAGKIWEIILSGEDAKGSNDTAKGIETA